jgi:hypothetical protein
VEYANPFTGRTAPIQIQVAVDSDDPRLAGRPGDRPDPPGRHVVGSDLRLKSCADTLAEGGGHRPAFGSPPAAHS